MVEEKVGFTSALDGATLFNQKLPWANLHNESDTTNVLHGASSFKWTLGCWPSSTIPANAPNCTSAYVRACVDCSISPSPPSRDRSLYIASITIVLASAAIHFIFFASQ